MTGKNWRKPSHRLTFEEAVEIWLRIWRGEFQNRIAADFDVNPGRVCDVKMGRLHPGSRDVAISRLKPSDRDAA